MAQGLHGPWERKELFLPNRPKIATSLVPASASFFSFLVHFVPSRRG
jgi:hypothetical protein